MNEMRQDLVGFAFVWFLVTLLTFTLNIIVLSDISKELSEVKESLKNENNISLTNSTCSTS